MNDIELNKHVYAFELDDVLFPKQDYMLQVYYLFANFYEFSEGTFKANDLVGFFKKVYLIHGEDNVFDSAKEVFGIEEKYRENLERLKANAQLPLKLELFPDKSKLLAQLFASNKNVVILTKGNPVEQLNKIKFIDWGTLAEFSKDIKVYFVDELRYQDIQPIDYLVEEFAVSKDEIVIVG